MKIEIILIVALCFYSGLLQNNVQGSSSRSAEGKRELLRGFSHLKKKTRDSFNNTEVIAQIGGTAALRCHTQRMPDQLVTWMKRGEEQLITAGLQVYSSEKRYSVAHLRHQKVWELRIRDVKSADEGPYECQLTTHPPVSILFTLRVVEARAAIRGPRELHVHEGSRLKLHCHVELATEPPLYVFWFHNETMINFEARRPLRVTKQLYGSSLTITNVSRSDAGMYRCEPHLATSDNVTLHVIAGENSAAMQKGQKQEDGNHFAQKSSVSLSSSSSTIITSQLKLLVICFLGLALYSSINQGFLYFFSQGRRNHNTNIQKHNKGNAIQICRDRKVNQNIKEYIRYSVDMKDRELSYKAVISVSEEIPETISRLNTCNHNYNILPNQIKQPQVLANELTNIRNNFYNNSKRNQSLSKSQIIR